MFNILPKTSRDNKLHYTDEGSGIPIILIHGFGICSTQWRYTAPHLLEAGYRVITLDLPGFGLSYLPKTPITTSSYTQTLFELMDALSIDEAVLIGSSMGGFVAWYAAAQQPTRFKGLVLVNPSGMAHRERSVGEDLRKHKGRRGVLQPGYASFPLFRTVVGWQLTNFLTRRLVAPIIYGSFGNIENLSDEVYETLHQAAKKARIIFSDRLQWQPLDEDPKALLSRIKCPTLVVWGDRDMIIPVQSLAFFMSVLPNAQSQVYPGIGHVPMLEVPQQFTADTLAFLNTLRQ